MTEVYLVDFGGEFEIHDCEIGLIADGLSTEEVQEYILGDDGEPWAVVVRTETAQ